SGSTSGFAAAGSASSINLDHDVEAFIARGTQVSTTGSIYLNADDHATVVVVAGSAGLGSSAGVGLSFGNLNFSRTVLAYVADEAVVRADGMSGTGILDPGGGGFGGRGLTINASAEDQLL